MDACHLVVARTRPRGVDGRPGRCAHPLFYLPEFLAGVTLGDGGVARRGDQWTPAARSGSRRPASWLRVAVLYVGAPRLSEGGSRPPRVGYLLHPILTVLSGLVIARARTVREDPRPAGPARAARCWLPSARLVLRVLPAAPAGAPAATCTSGGPGRQRQQRAPRDGRGDGRGGARRWIMDCESLRVSGDPPSEHPAERLDAPPGSRAAARAPGPPSRVRHGRRPGPVPRRVARRGRPRSIADRRNAPLDGTGAGRRTARGPGR